MPRLLLTSDLDRYGVRGGPGWKSLCPPRHPAFTVHLACASGVSHRCPGCRIHPGDLLEGPRGLNPGLLHCRQILYCLSHNGSPLSLAHHLYTPTPRHPYLGKSLSLPGVCFSPCNWGEHPPPLPMSEGLHWEGSGIIDNIVFLQFPVIFNFSKMNTCYLNYKNCICSGTGSPALGLCSP